MMSTGYYHRGVSLYVYFVYTHICKHNVCFIYNYPGLEDTIMTVYPSTSPAAAGLAWPAINLQPTFVTSFVGP